MPWIINDLGIELMLVSARERGFEIDCWWRDEVALLEHWELAGYGESPAVVALSAGGLYAYVSVYRGSLTLIGLAPLIQPGKFEYDITELQAARATLTPFITQYTKRKDAAVPLEPLRPGDRIGGCALIGLEGLLGIAAEVDGLGRCTWVQLEADKPPVLASTVGLRWWKWNDRDAAFDHYWHEGRTRFSHYRAMQGALVGKQKALLKAFGKAPGKPAGRPATVRSPDVPSKGGVPPVPAKSGFAAMDPAALSAWLKKAQLDMPVELVPRQKELLRSFDAMASQERERTGGTQMECWVPFRPLYAEELHRLISGPLPVAIDKPIKFGPPEDLGLEPDDEEPTET